MACVPPEHQAKVLSTVTAILRAGGKGAFGNAIEAGHFYYIPNSSARPDLGWAELKCTGLLPDGDGGHRAKERLVICMINYGGNPDSRIPSVVEETAETSHAFRKLLSILLVFYDYSKVLRSEDLLDIPIHLVDIWAPAPGDVALFKRDWEVIQGYVREGRAHELSEGLTPMLGACTKSSDSGVTVAQGYGEPRAKPRAFALKQAYVTEIFRQLKSRTRRDAPEPVVVDEMHFDTMTKNHSLEKKVAKGMNGYVGMSPEQICEELSLTGEFGGKGGTSRRMNKFANKIATGFQYQKITQLPEFLKSGLTIKVVRIKENGQAAEAVSFPAFEYDEVAAEDCWEDSSLYQDLVKRFLFVFLRDHGDDRPLKFDKAVFWSMPETDLERTEKVWADTVSLIRQERLEELPRDAETLAVHVRPHDRRRYPGFKRSYWLNRRYVTKIWSGDAYDA
jgi:DNA mismatch repair protein MutH